MEVLWETLTISLASNGGWSIAIDVTKFPSGTKCRLETLASVILLLGIDVVSDTQCLSYSNVVLYENIAAR